VPRPSRFPARSKVAGRVTGILTERAMRALADLISEKGEPINVIRLRPMARDELFQRALHARDHGWKDLERQFMKLWAARGPRERLIYSWRANP
jgi:hypothetical protein